MKKFIYILSAAMVLLVSAAQANAQMGKKYYINGGWQFNGTIDNEVVQSGQGFMMLVKLCLDLLLLVQVSLLVVQFVM
jgi:uncharacterized protein (DUF2141 family)